MYPRRGGKKEERRAWPGDRVQRERERERERERGKEGKFEGVSWRREALFDRAPPAIGSGTWRIESSTVWSAVPQQHTGALCLLLGGNTRPAATSRRPSPNGGGRLNTVQPPKLTRFQRLGSCVF